jgi:hypothetical protein
MGEKGVWGSQIDGEKGRRMDRVIGRGTYRECDVEIDGKWKEMRRGMDRSMFTGID